MKKPVITIGAVFCIFLLVGCAVSEPGTQNAETTDTNITDTNLQNTEVLRVIQGNREEYEELQDGRWKAGEYIYQYRLEISGHMSNAAKDSTFVYLSNIEHISFDRAWKAAGFSSNLEDYFSPGEAVLVEAY